MTHAELIIRAERWLLRTKGCGFTLVELACYSNSGEIPDVIGFKQGRSHLVECKANRADFLGDSKKTFRRRPELGMGSYRYYATPASLIERVEVPARWGLLWVYPAQVRLIKRPTFWPDTASKDLPILCSALRRVHIRGDLRKIYEPDPRR